MYMYMYMYMYARIYVYMHMCVYVCMYDETDRNNKFKKLKTDRNNSIIVL